MASGPQRILLSTVAAICCVTAAGACGSSGRIWAPELSAPVPVGPSSATALSSVIQAARLTLKQSAVVSLRLVASQVLGVSGRAVTGSGQFDLATSRGLIELGRPTGSERMIFLPESLFVAQTGGASLLPKGKVWISAGLTEQSLATNFPQFVTQAESLNPGLLLWEIASGSVSAAPLSPTGGGAAYLVKIDLSKSQSGASGPLPGAFSKAVGYEITEQSGGSLPTVTVEVDLERQGRIVMMRSSPPGAGMGTVTLALSGWGVPVSVGQPPRAQVVDISSLAPGGERENAGGGDTDGA